MGAQQGTGPLLYLHSATGVCAISVTSDVLKNKTNFEELNYGLLTEF